MKALFSALFIFFSLTAMAQTKYTVGAYKIDPMTEIVINTTSGTMSQLDGCIELHENFEKSRVLLFDDQSDPKIKFVSSGIKGSLEKFKLMGELTLHGVTKQIVFDTHYIGVVADGFGSDKAAFIGKTKIFNQRGEEISVDLRLLATRPSKTTEEMYETVYHMVK